MTTLAAWAARHAIPPAALADLRAMLTAPEPSAAAIAPVERSEAAVQVDLRLRAAREGLLCFRNNVGALLDARGVPVRYGLANDTAAMNRSIKSADLVGVKPVLITPAHVGTVIGQFWCREVKHAGWRWRGDAHELAQLAWAELVLSWGGDAGFATDGSHY